MLFPSIWRQALLIFPNLLEIDRTKHTVPFDISISKKIVVNVCYKEFTSKVSSTAFLYLHNTHIIIIFKCFLDGEKICVLYVSLMKYFERKK